MEMEVNDVGLGGTVGVLVVGLAIVVAVAFFWSGVRKEFLQPTENFLLARRSQPWWSLALCFYCSGMGTWLLFATPETGATAGLWAVAGYALSNGTAFWLFAWIGPRVLDLMEGKGFCLSDFVQKRLGVVMSVTVSLASLFFMFIFLTAELTSIADVFTILSPTFPPLGVTLPIAFVTLTYTLVLGLMSSIVTDRVQGFIIAIFAVLATVSSIAWAVPSITKENWHEAKDSTTNGGYAFFMLLISVTINELLNQGDWQRIYSAKTKRDAVLGLLVGGALTVPTVFLFGTTGYVALAAKFAGIIDYPEGMEFASFFVLLLHMNTAWLVIVLFLSVCLVATTVDTLQNGMASLVGNFIVSRNYSLNWARLFVLLINVPAIILAGLRYSVLKFFVVSNIISCAIVPAIFLGLSPETATPIGATVGSFFGILSIFICGWSFTGDFVDGLKWVTFPDGPYTLQTLLTFIIVPAAATTATIAISRFQIWWDPQVLTDQRLWFARQQKSDMWDIDNEQATSSIEILSIETSKN